jgi:hypothetical protein
VTNPPQTEEPATPMQLKENTAFSLRKERKINEGRKGERNGGRKGW